MFKLDQDLSLFLNSFNTQLQVMLITTPTPREKNGHAACLILIARYRRLNQNPVNKVTSKCKILIYITIHQVAT